MAKHTIEVNFSEFTAKIVNSNRSALGKRGITGGINVDLSKIPSNVLTNLLIDAVTAYVQVGLKTLDQSTATVEDCQKAMKTRLAILESGAVSAAGSARKPPTRDPVKAAAKMMVKKAIQDRSEEKLDGKVLTKMVSDLFKLHDQWAKEGSDPAHKHAKAAQMVANSIATARASYEQQQAMSESLTSMAAKAQKLTAEAAARKAEAAPEAEAEAPKPKAKPKAKAAAR